MFKRQNYKNVAPHIRYYKYKRDKNSRVMPLEDKIAIQEFYTQQGINYPELTTYQQLIQFKQTLHYTWILARYFEDKNHHIRTQSYLFHNKGSEILFELDHDYQVYGNQVQHKKLLKLNYEVHDLLDDPNLINVGRFCENLVNFERACNTLLANDNLPQSIHFVLDD